MSEHKFGQGGIKSADFREMVPEAKLTFEQKLLGLKQAYEKKINDLEREKGAPLTSEEKQTITLTIPEYNKYRDRHNSVLAQNISRGHNWPYALQKAGIPILNKSPETYFSGDVQKKILNFRDSFSKSHDKLPDLKDYTKARSEGLIPANNVIKKNTGATGLKDLLVRLGLI